jgi:hypothetical protein
VKTLVQDVGIEPTPRDYRFVQQTANDDSFGRWFFDDITPNLFVWRAEFSNDAGRLGNLLPSSARTSCEPAVPEAVIGRVSTRCNC